jgi:hypothetical protein
MNKNTQYTRNQPGPKKSVIHPIWRGIGFVLMLGIPILSFLASQIVLEMNATQNWFPIPQDLIIPWQDPMILIKLLLTLAISFVVFAIFMIITFTAFSLFGPSRYVPPDLPPLRVKTRRSR